ncbi:hypothetical protein SJY04_22230, partial [Aeromonas dhakensis]|uniref:hypothetical protein n=1 Tax=Aeromonas dhakensis TaxID=196024 RepID=UPI0029D42FF9
LQAGGERQIGEGGNGHKGTRRDGRGHAALETVLMAGMVTDAGPRAEGAAGSAAVKHLFQCVHHGAHP